MTVDVSDPEDIKRAGEEVRENYGIPDLVFNNAGILGGFNIFECDVEKYDRTMRVNTRSALLVEINLFPCPKLISLGKQRIPEADD